MNHIISVTKSDGTKQLFEEEKLVNSLKRVGATPEVVDDVIDEVEKQMFDGIKTEEIYHKAFDLLKRREKHVAAAKYSVKRAMMELGPDGFPFEKFVARIFKEWGYETITDVNVPGTCVDHEVDVVAWKGNDLAMSEVKYHNEYGMKSDLKVVLYVKARFDDISPNALKFGGKELKLTERYLFTNTKFTEKAIAYGKCTGLKLVGWNYPQDENLHEIIFKNGLHPISCITTLTRDQKRELIQNNALVCLDIVGNPNILEKIGVKPENRENVLTEVQKVIQEAK